MVLQETSSATESMVVSVFGSLRKLKWRQSISTTAGICLIWLIFYAANDRFLSSVNLTNLILQIAAVGTIAIGANLLLLIGEIDLSIGIVSGLSAAMMAVLNVRYHLPALPAVLAGVATGALTGLVTGSLVTVFRIPSFIVSLAGLLAWQGVLLRLVGSLGTINIRDPSITFLAGSFVSQGTGALIGLLVIAVYSGILFSEEAKRRRSSVKSFGTRNIVLRIAAVASLGVASILIFGSDRGVPIAFLIFIGLVIGVETLCRRTLFGRHIYAVGGNPEAARRAGIRVQRVKILVFVIAAAMAAIGGMLAAARLQAVSQASGGGDILLQAIAAAVIGGTSLFGGRGTIWAAFLGSLLIGSISNGMDLLAFDSAIKYMVTGAVLVLAVIVDAGARGNWQKGSRA
jgi:D-xylose transport system permease protein